MRLGDGWLDAYISTLDDYECPDCGGNHVADKGRHECAECFGGDPECDECDGTGEAVCERCERAFYGE